MVTPSFLRVPTLACAVALLLCAAGCASRRSELGDPDTGPGPTDAGIGRDAPPPSPDAGGEACDGADDDADGSIDEGCPCPALGDSRACTGDGTDPACGSHQQRCMNAGEFGMVWSACELIVPPEGCPPDAGPPTDAGVDAFRELGPPGACGRAGSTGVSED